MTTSDLLTPATTILITAVADGVSILQLSQHPDELRALEGHGVTLVSTPRIESDDASPDSADYLRARLNIDELLTAALEPLGFSPDGSDDSFALFTIAGIADLRVAFLKDSSVPLYAAGGLEKKPKLTVVLHVAPAVDPALNNVLHLVGLHEHSLQEVAKITPDFVAELISEIDEVMKVAGGGSPVLTVPEIKAIAAKLGGLDLGRVLEYASTEGMDREFELATTGILQPFFDRTFSLGAGFTGKALPDGLAIVHTDRPEAAIIDAKNSKSGYDFPAGDGDELHRYLTILKRLKGDWRRRGILLACSSPATAKFEGKIGKDIWSRIKEDDFMLRVVPAFALLRLYSLFRGEHFETLTLSMDRPRFWSALFDGELSAVPEQLTTKLIPERRDWARILRTEDAELCFLSAIIEPHRDAEEVARSLGVADPSTPGLDKKVLRPRIISLFVKALNKKGVTLDELMNATGLTTSACTYLLHCELLERSVALRDWGDRGPTNRTRLRKENA